MIKNLIVILAILVVGVLLFSSGMFPNIKGVVLTQNTASQSPALLPPNESLIKLSSPVLAIPSTESSLATQAWTVFQNYLQFAKNHNLSGIRGLSHQISTTCNDTTKEKECFVLMDNVYSLASPLKLSDFNHIQSDEHQIIMYTDGPTVVMLYFVKESGSIKVLGMRFCFEDEKTVGTCVNTSSIKNDSNGNGWWDSVESLFY